jgi:ribosomal protein S18 acetylase RimI-like enzyme
MIKIRKMKIEDVEEVFNLGVKEERFNVSKQNKTPFWTKEQLMSWVKNNKDVLLIAEDNGKTVGYALSTYHFPTGKATFENLYVVEEYRNKGVGKKLTTNLIKELKKIGSTYICTLVESDNTSIMKCLEKSGFVRGKDFTWMEFFIN